MTTEHPIQSMLLAELRRKPISHANLAEIWHAGLVHEDCAVIDWAWVTAQLEAVLGIDVTRNIRLLAINKAQAALTGDAA